MAELAKNKAKDFAPESVRLAFQQTLASLQGAVNTATLTGIKYGQTITINKWELAFVPAKEAGQLPELVHAVYKK